MFRISIHILYFAFVSAIGRRSFTVFFGSKTVFDVFQDAGMLFYLCIIWFIVSV